MCFAMNQIISNLSYTRGITPIKSVASLRGPYHVIAPEQHSSLLLGLFSIKLMIVTSYSTAKKKIKHCLRKYKLSER